MKHEFTDVLVIGSGIAGLMTADFLRNHMNVTILTKSALTHSNSYRAQGGIAAVQRDEDHWQAHFFDTLQAGYFHNEESITKLLVKEGPEAIALLESWNVPLDRDECGKLALGREGGHHEHRIVHAGGDQTGKKIIDTLQQRVKAHVTLKEYEMVGNLVIEADRCVGAWTKHANGEVTMYHASHVVLAAGGAAGLYEVSSNDRSITGDSIALAYRAGALLSDLEFIQFHPTMLMQEGHCYGLVSEAVRGEGGRLVTKDGKHIMDGVHALGDLAPRDVVAREIFRYYANGDAVFLDISKVKNFTKRFPAITKLCGDANVDLHQQRIPVAPGAHFTMGGVVANACGQTSIAGLYAVGEAARTGVHGANRLASNSLLEGIVFAKKTALYIASLSRTVKAEQRHALSSSTQEQPMGPLPTAAAIRDVLSKDVSIVRDEAGLQRALAFFAPYEAYAPTMAMDTVTLETLNMLHVGRLITLSAYERQESRGAHYRMDYPTMRETWNQHQIYRRREDGEQTKIARAAQSIFA
ncbi:L-aspartate oxidase [Fictibacillus macauensis ZFHKF-1]|uniref:L-aspartate oxidase n=1 Tax=Fictibacillus macauensis ZFHKF-1 TaxID=1196324 RepID=I8J0P1_9BACL|nr:L-aspartate oxidase [Fictibacillus macauensis]EIT85326.1 L-aspartate oxidase [Fictibacillus macauensis ZFHKF-1]